MDHGRGRDSDVAGSKIQCLRVPGWALLCETGMPSQGCRVEGDPLRGSSPSPHHPSCEAITRRSGPTSRCQPSPGAGGHAGIYNLHPSPQGWGRSHPAPPSWPRASWGVSIRLAPARSDNSPGGDPAAQRGLPREGSPLIPGLTRPEDKQFQIAPSPFPAGAAAVRPSSRLRCSPVRLDKRDARPELFGFVPYVQEKDAQGIPAALLADAPHSEGF